MTGQDVQRLEARIAALEARMTALESAQERHLRDHAAIEATLIEIRTGVRLIKWGVGVLTSGGVVGLATLLLQTLGHA